jgi:prephenate dehydrogenase
VANQDVQFQKIAILGVGLIGGSLAMVCKQKGLAGMIVGYGRRLENLKKAVKLGVIDRFFQDLRETVRGADLIVLATPVGRFEALAREIAEVASKEAIVMDVGSVKGDLVARLERLLPYGSRFVGTHPIAGKEKTGVESASATLFSGALCILTPTDRTDPSALESVKALWKAAGAKLILMDPAQHDQILAAVSHLPHLAAYALVNTVLETRVQGQEVLSFSGGGLRDFTRIAASSPEMWRDICLLNRDPLLGMIEAYEKTLARLKKLIQQGDGESLEAEFERAKEVRERTGEWTAS